LPIAKDFSRMALRASTWESLQCRQLALSSMPISRTACKQEHMHFARFEKGEGCELEKVVVAGMYMFESRHTRRYLRLQHNLYPLSMTADTMAMHRHSPLTQCIVLSLTPAWIADKSSSSLLAPSS
jgi:hypothetical protein